MCGFAGVVDWESVVAPTELDDALGVLRKRGPDDSGIVSDEWYVLGHRRLSILDLSVRGRQPMPDASGRFVVVYNGEIYNYRELNGSLGRRGFRAHTGTDTETLVNAFAIDGVGAFPGFAGMFAGAIVDRRAREVFLFRDRLGVKPVYYGRRGSRIAFASTPSVVASLLGGTPIAEDRLLGYLAFRTAPVDGSFFSGISAVRPGTVLQLGSMRQSEHVYWSLATFFERDRTVASESQSLDLQDSEILRLVTTSIERRLLADVPVGAFLSGGLDSTIVLDRMTHLARDTVHTYTYGSLEESANESEPALMTAKRYGARATLMSVDLEGHFDDVRELTMLKGAPLAVPNEFAIYRLSRALRETCTVVLSGEGADELFLGYTRLFAAAIEQDAAQQPLRPDDRAAWLFDRYRYVSENALRTFGMPAARVRLYRERGIEYITRILSEVDDDTLLGGVHYFFFRHHLPGLLMRLDNATMAASVEGRAPFTDHDLVEYVLRFAIFRRPSLWGKRHLYRAFNHLPEWVLRAEKIGFKLGDATAGDQRFVQAMASAGLVQGGGAELGSVSQAERWHLAMLGIFAQEHDVVLV